MERVTILFSRGSPHLGIEPEFPALAGSFLITEPLGKSCRSMILSWRDGAHFSQVWGKRFWSNRTACFHVLRALVWYKSGNFWSPPAFLLADILLLWSPPEMPLEGVHSYSFSLIILLFYLLYSKTQASPGSRHVPMSSEAGRGSCGVGAAGPFRVCVAEAGDVGLTSGTLRLDRKSVV